MVSNEVPDKIIFNSPFLSANYCLIEVDKELAEHVRSGKTFLSRGRETDPLTFCTDDTTYRVREVETTNTLLLSNVNKVKTTGTGENYRIQAFLKTYFELTKEEMSPYLAVKSLLEKFEFDLNYPNTNTTISMNEVLDVIPYSEAEIVAAIKRLPVVENDNVLRYLKRSFRENMLGKLVDVMDDYLVHNISIKEINTEAMKNFFEDDPTVFVEWLFRTYCSPGVPNIIAICRDRAVEILYKRKVMGITAFEYAMTKLLPIGMEFDRASLRGIAVLKNVVGREQIIEHLNVEDLPPDPKERLRILFKVKSNWSAEDIEPYVIDFCTPKFPVNAFLMKNCQSVKEGDEKVFVQKDNNF